MNLARWLLLFLVTYYYFMCYYLLLVWWYAVFRHTRNSPAKICISQLSVFAEMINTMWTRNSCPAFHSLHNVEYNLLGDCKHTNCRETENMTNYWNDCRAAALHDDDEHILHIYDWRLAEGLSQEYVCILTTQITNCIARCGLLWDCFWLLVGSDGWMRMMAKDFAMMRNCAWLSMIEGIVGLIAICIEMHRTNYIVNAPQGHLWFLCRSMLFPSTKQ